MAPRHAPISARRAILALTAFGIAFGYLEASVVVYLRAIYDPVRSSVYPGIPAGELFPLLRPDQLPQPRLLLIELGREFATLLMLAAPAYAIARNRAQWLAAFAFAFGVWDIWFYIFLKVMIGWPASLFTWDILFLLPGPWAGPVISPCIVAATMIAAGAYVLVRESGSRPFLARGLDFMGILAGALVVIAAFMWDWRNTLAGNLPNPFNWPLFWLGEIIGLAAFLRAALRRPAAAG